MVEICALLDFPDGDRRLVTVAESGYGRDIVVFREGERFYAIDDACTHVGASHLKSRVEDGIVECWLHKGRFCLESGEPVRYPARITAQVHTVQVINGVVVLRPGVHPRDAS